MLLHIFQQLRSVLPDKSLEQDYLLLKSLTMNTRSCSIESYYLARCKTQYNPTQCQLLIAKIKAFNLISVSDDENKLTLDLVTDSLARHKETALRLNSLPSLLTSKIPSTLFWQQASNAFSLPIANSSTQQWIKKPIQLLRQGRRLQVSQQQLSALLSEVEPKTLQFYCLSHNHRQQIEFDIDHARSLTQHNLRQYLLNFCTRLKQTVSTEQSQQKINTDLPFFLQKWLLKNERQWLNAILSQQLHELPINQQYFFTELTQFDLSKLTLAERQLCLMHCQVFLR